MAGIYLHIPFCYKRCDYCDFFKSTNISFKTEFLKVLLKEIEQRTPFFDNESVETIYFGGGTPSVLHTDEVADILKQIKGLTGNFESIKEITFELNPDDGTLDYLMKLRATGVNRLSIGIQSFDNDLLKIMNRRHDAKQAKEVVINARKAGFENISIDLMYGLPGLDSATWLSTINMALDLCVEHISAYHLSYEAGTVFHRKLKKGLFMEMDEDESLSQFKVLISKLKEAGFEHYEISNFSKPDKHSRHNSNYWNGKSYLGFGPSAHSYNGFVRAWNKSELDLYLKGQFMQKEEVLSETDKFNERIMLKLRTSNGLSIHELQVQTKELYRSHFFESIKKHIDQKNVKVSNGHYQFSQKGLFISDHILADLFYEE